MKNKKETETEISSNEIKKQEIDVKKIKELLKESEEKFQVFFKGATDGFIAADPKTKKFLFVNPKICELIGYNEKELLKLGVEDIHPCDHIYSGCYHGGRVDKSAYRSWAFHSIWKPDIKRNLSGFSHGSNKEENGYQCNQSLC